MPYMLRTSHCGEPHSPAHPAPWLPLLRGVLACVSLALPLAACGDDNPSSVSSELCRFDPVSCPGASGALCRRDVDCQPGLFCCTEDSNCGGGMCTLQCKDDLECPPDMACEHSKCFYRCDSDIDCAEGMSCEHAHTVCEWK